MNEKIKEDLQELMEYEARGVQDQKQIKADTIRRLVNYRFNEDEAYSDGFSSYLGDTIVYSPFGYQILLDCIDYVLNYDFQKE